MVPAERELRFDLQKLVDMGTFALGDIMVTKPYVSGAAYINRMSDYCRECAFNPKKNYPITPLYWGFLARHQKTLRGNPRLGMPYASLKKRSKDKMRKDHATFQMVQKALMASKPIKPKDI